MIKPAKRKMEKHDSRLDAMEENHKHNAADGTFENHKHTAADGTFEASSSQRDLVSGLIDDVVLGEIIPRWSRATPRDKRPVLSLLSRSWANAVAVHSSYDRAYHPSATLSSREFIVSRVIPYRQHREFSNTDASSLWVCDPFRGMVSTLPPPPNPNILTTFDANLVFDGESVYVLSPAAVTEEQNIPFNVYDVWMLDLREFNLRWKKLPSLPRLGDRVYASTCEGERYIWQRRLKHSSEADGWKLSVSGEWQWQYVNVNTPPPQNLVFDKSERLPFYIEMNGAVDEQFPEKFLYARSSLPRYILDFQTSRGSYIFMLPDVDSDESRPIIYGDLYCFEVDPDDENGGLCILKAELDNAKTTTVEEGEWGGFVLDWFEVIFNTGFTSAIKAFMSTSYMFPWKIQCKLKLENWKNNKWLDELMVLQNGPLYGYRLMRV